VVANNTCAEWCQSGAPHGVARALQSGIYPQLLELNSPEEIFKRAHDLSTVRDMVHALLRDAPRLELAAQGSYFHKLGFAKIVLARNLSRGSTVRLHVWWPDRKPDIERDKLLRVHSHRWDFTSRVLHGSLKSELYFPADSGVPVLAYACHPPLGGNFHRMELLGRLLLRTPGPVTYSSGDVYALSHDVMHRVVTVPSSLTATLVLRNATRQKASIVCSSRPIVDPEHIELEKLDVQGVRSVLDKFLTATESLRNAERDR
jgi:hypothetical protein